MLRLFVPYSSYASRSTSYLPGLGSCPTTKEPQEVRWNPPFEQPPLSHLPNSSGSYPNVVLLDAGHGFVILAWHFNLERLQCFVEGWRLGTSQFYEHGNVDWSILAHFFNYCSPDSFEGPELWRSHENLPKKFRIRSDVLGFDSYACR